MRRCTLAPDSRARLTSAWLPLLLALALSLAGCGPRPWAEPGEIENVVLVSIDTLRADHLGAYGYERETSPFLDRLATEGLLFEQAVSSASWTLPAHATLLTGLEPSTHRAVDAEAAISGTATLAAELLHEAGFATAGFVTAWFVSERYGFQRGFDVFHDLSRASRRPRQKVRAERVVDAGLEWVRNHPERPFFLFLHLYDVHYDYDPPEAQAALFDTGYEGRRKRYQSYPYYLKHPLKPERLAHEVAMYDGEVRYVDGELERLWEELDALGRRSGTLLVVTSDHGEEFFEHGSWGHAHTLYDEQVRVPLVFAGAGVRGDRRITAQVRLVDVLPTLIEALGLRRPEGLDGASLWSLVAGAEDPGAGDRDRPAWLETWRKDTRRIGLRWRGHKLLTDLATGEEELYDLLDDPGEVRDLLAADAGNDPSSILEGMRQRLRAATLEAVTDRWRVERVADGGEPDLELSLRTDGRFYAAATDSGEAVAIAADGRGLEVALAPGETLELVVLPIDAEITLETPDAAVPIVVGGAPPVAGPGPVAFSASTTRSAAADVSPPGPALVVRLTQEHLGAEEVELDEDARRRLEALGYLVD